jgi:hypothetical protein
VDCAVDSELEPLLRQWLQLRIDDWRGGAMPLSRAWVEDEVASLCGADRAKARAVLLVMKASYQMDDSVIDELESHGVDEAGLIKLGAWAALSAARRVAAWTAADFCCTDKAQIVHDQAPAVPWPSISHLMDPAYS